MTDESKSTADNESDFLDVFMEMEPLVFDEPAIEGDLRVSRAKHYLRSNGQEFVLHIAVSGPAAWEADVHRQAVSGLQAGVALMLAPDDEPPAEGESEPAEPSDEESEHLTFEVGPIDVSDSTSSSFHVLVAVDPSIRKGEIDKWRTTGEVRRGQIKVTAGRATLRSSNASDSKAAVAYTKSINAKSLEVVGLANASSYTFFGRYILT
jgi:hypothetical protein